MSCLIALGKVEPEWSALPSWDTEIQRQRTFLDRT
jgi:hypothetical protein